MSFYLFDEQVFKIIFETSIKLSSKVKELFTPFKSNYLNKLGIRIVKISKN